MTSTRRHRPRSSTAPKSAQSIRSASLQTPQAAAETRRPLGPAELSRQQRAAGLGLAGVVVYAVLAGLHALVINPLAAVPGSGLGDIYSRVAASGHSMGVPGALGILAAGVAIGVVVFRWIRTRPDLSPLTVTHIFLWLIAAGGFGSFYASLLPNTALAQTYGIGSGDRSPLGLVLMGISILAVLAVFATSWARLLKRPAE